MKAIAGSAALRGRMLAAALLIGLSTAVLPPSCGAQLRKLAKPAGAPAATASNVPVAASQANLALGYTEFVSGTLLRVTCAERAKLYRDGALLGYTPMLLTLEPGLHSIEIVGIDKVDRRSVEVRGGIEGVTTLEAALRPYQGLLSVSCELPTQTAASITLSIDSLPPESIPADPITLEAGNHSLKVAAEGFTAYDAMVSVPRDGIARVAARLERGYPLRLDPMPPSGSVVLSIDDKGKTIRSMDPRAENLLPAGLAKFRIVLASGRTLDFEWDPASGKAAKAETMASLKFGNLPAGCSITVDGTPLPVAPDALFATVPPLAVQPGFHVIKVSKEGYVSALLWCDLAPGGEYVPTAALERDPRIVAREKAMRVTSFLTVGALASVTGLVLAQDSAAVGLSVDYQSYKNIKLASMGLVGGGVAFLCLGASFAL